MSSGARRIAFDELAIYIHVKKTKKHGVEVVDRIEWLAEVYCIAIIYSKKSSTFSRLITENTASG